MSIQELKDKADAIRRGEYEKFAHDERVNFYTAVAMLAREVRAIAWQPGYKEEALAIIAQLQADRPRKDLPPAITTLLTTEQAEILCETLERSVAELARLEEAKKDFLRKLTAELRILIEQQGTLKEGAS